MKRVQSQKTSELEAILLDESYLTNVITAAAGRKTRIQILLPKK
ncbi:MAG: hypothetical protein U9O50_09135 [Acidobacteriota bacterium]|nr:hypothetical protein [Acidobacteriota bacterium]